jgi:hypothetical protein
MLSQKSQGFVPLDLKMPGMNACDGKTYRTRDPGASPFFAPSQAAQYRMTTPLDSYILLFKFHGFLLNLTSWGITFVYHQREIEYQVAFCCRKMCYSRMFIT